MQLSILGRKPTEGAERLRVVARVNLMEAESIVTGLIHLIRIAARRLHEVPLVAL